MRKWVSILMLLATGVAPGALAQHWPVQVYGRYFVDSTGAPWLIVGDNSGYNLLAYETMDRIDAYFADRAEHGFNTVWMNVVRVRSPHLEEQRGTTGLGAVADDQRKER